MNMRKIEQKKNLGRREWLWDGVGQVGFASKEEAEEAMEKCDDKKMKSRDGEEKRVRIEWLEKPSEKSRSRSRSGKKDRSRSRSEKKKSLRTY